VLACDPYIRIFACATTYYMVNKDEYIVIFAVACK